MSDPSRQKKDSASLERARELKISAFPSLWRNPPKGDGRLEFPLIVGVESTNHCNLKCVFCNRTYDLDRESYRDIGNMDFELYKKIADEVAERGGTVIKPNKEGEPLLHKKIVDMVAYAKGKGIPIVEFNTNGTLLTESMSRRLLEAGLDKIAISVDSPYPDRFARLRPGADLETIRRNVAKFHELSKKNGHNCMVSLAAIRMSDTTEEEIAALRKDWGGIVDQIGINQYYIPQGKGSLKRFGVKPAREKTFCCDELFRILVILWDGDVVPCCHDFDKTLVVGNVKKQSIHEIWNGPEMENLRRLHLEGRHSEIPACAKCGFLLNWTAFNGGDETQTTV